MRRKRNEKKLGYQGLESRKLLAADFGMSLMSFDIGGPSDAFQVVELGNFDVATETSNLNSSEAMSFFVDSSMEFGSYGGEFGFDSAKLQQLTGGSYSGGSSAGDWMSADVGMAGNGYDFQSGMFGDASFESMPMESLDGEMKVDAGVFNGVFGGKFIGDPSNGSFGFVQLVGDGDLFEISDIGGLNDGMWGSHGEEFFFGGHFNGGGFLDVDFDNVDVVDFEFNGELLDLDDGSDGVFGSLNTDNASETYSFFAAEDGLANIVLASSLSDGDVSVEVRNQDGEVVEPSVAGSDSRFTKLGFDVAAGQVYELVVSAAEGAEGDFQLTVTMEAAEPVDQHAGEIGADATVLDMSKGFVELSGDLETDGDVDVFQFEASESGQVALFVQELDYETSAKLSVTVSSASGEEIASGATNAGVSITFEANESKTYFVSLNADKGQTGTYQIGLLQNLDSDVDGEDVDGEDVDGEDVDGEDVDGEDVDGEDVDGEDVDGEDVDGEDVDGEDVDGEEVDGEEVDGDEVDGDEVDGDEVDGDEVDGDEVDGDEVDGDEVDGDEVDRVDFERSGSRAESLDLHEMGLSAKGIERSLELVMVAGVDGMNSFSEIEVAQLVAFTSIPDSSDAMKVEGVAVDVSGLGFMGMFSDEAPIFVNLFSNELYGEELDRERNKIEVGDYELTLAEAEFLNVEIEKFAMDAAMLESMDKLMASFLSDSSFSDYSGSHLSFGDFHR